jgi:hypothetical protein
MPGERRKIIHVQVVANPFFCTHETAHCHMWLSVIQFIENQRPLRVLNITCLPSGVAAEAAFGILHAYNVS